MTDHAPRPDIAIIGASALFPGSLSSTGFWHDVLASEDLISDVPASHWLHEDYYDADPKAPDKTYAKRGAFLGDVDFDALAWGIRDTRNTQKTSQGAIVFTRQDRNKQ